MSARWQPPPPELYPAPEVTQLRQDAASLRALADRPDRRGLPVAVSLILEAEDLEAEADRLDEPRLAAIRDAQPGPLARFLFRAAGWIAPGPAA